MEVFLVDDSKPVLDRLEETLSEISQVNVLGRAFNVADAKKYIQTLLPDVVISDINLPGKSGIDLLRYVKQTFHDIIFIIFSIYSFPQYRKFCAKLNADFFFQKGIENEALRQTIEILSKNYMPLSNKFSSKD